MATKEKWKKIRGRWLAPTKLPGVWERKEGGYYVRGRAVDPETGKMQEISRVLLDMKNETEAYLWLEREQERVRAERAQPTSRVLFCDYSVSLLERKVTSREIKSARGRERWVNTLRHLIAGTKGATGFGDFYVDEIRVTHVEEWKAEMGKLVAAGKYEPATVNGWIDILFVILRRAQAEFDLEHDATKGVRKLDVAEHAVYTEEEPNALTEEESAVFLDCMFDNYPQHFAMAYLGLFTGLRPSSMRPLRRKGPEADVLWEKNVVLIRRSHTIGEEVMKTTKTNVRQRIHVPADLMAVLRWHVDTQLVTPEQKNSDLLFPSELGGFRGANVLQKPFRACAKAAGLGKRFTPRGMRRTFNDLARRAKLEGIVIKSVSGHLTDRMKQHYSTVDGEEQREGLGLVLSRVKADGVEIVKDIVGEPTKQKPSEVSTDERFSGSSPPEQ
jgi:integrase